MKDDMETECMNELFGKDEDLPHYHWYPVAVYDSDDNKIHDYTKQEQRDWILERLKNDKRRND